MAMVSSSCKDRREDGAGTSRGGEGLGEGTADDGRVTFMTKDLRQVGGWPMDVVEGEHHLYQ